MNNAINEIKNTLEATNSRITEAEGRISEVEDRVVEINEVTQSCPTLSEPHGLQPTRLPRPWEFPGKSTGVGCHCLHFLF